MLLGCGLVAASRLRRSAVGPITGQPKLVLPSGSSLVGQILSWMVLVAAAGFARFLGPLLGTMIYRVPERIQQAIPDSWPADLVMVVAWIGWTVLLGFAVGVFQIYLVRHNRATTTYGYGGHAQSHYEDTVVIPPPRLTGLRPVLNFWFVTDNSWTDSSSTSVGHNLFESAFTVMSWRYYRVQFPPAMVPGWLAIPERLARHLVRRRREERAQRARQQ